MFRIISLLVVKEKASTMKHICQTCAPTHINYRIVHTFARSWGFGLDAQGAHPGEDTKGKPKRRKYIGLKRER